MAGARPTGAHDGAAVPDRCRKCADRRRAGCRDPPSPCGSRPRAWALRARRGGRQRHARRSCILRRLTWRLGPGDRVGVVGVTDRARRPCPSERRRHRGDRRVVRRGSTVRLGTLSQDLEELPEATRSRGASPSRTRIALGDGRELTRSQLCERSGSPEPAVGVLADLSGGERCRLQPTRVMMASRRSCCWTSPRRSGHRHPDGARGSARRLAGDARRRQP